MFCAGTGAALVSFQHSRGLRVSDECDEVTWRALVEATWKLGDRLLVLTSPNLRGDDVVDLQSRLARLGFDSGRIDGIFGPLTAKALADFQSNLGLTDDGVCGHDTIRMLDRVMGQTGHGPGVAAVRERERLRQTPLDLASLRIAVGQFGGLGAIMRSISRDLRARGAHVLALDEPDPIIQARTANKFGANVFIGLEAAAGEATVVHYYRVPTFESVGGHTLADSLTAELRTAGIAVDTPAGVRIPVLRETKMPAVLCVVAPVRAAVDAAAAIGPATAHALEQWLSVWTLTR